MKLFQRSSTAWVMTKGHIRLAGQKKPLQLLTKIKVEMFVQNLESHCITLNILIYIQFVISTPTCQTAATPKAHSTQKH